MQVPSCHAKHSLSFSFHPPSFHSCSACIRARALTHLSFPNLPVGADVNARDKDNITALMEAAIMGHKDIVNHLIKKGAEVEATAASGVTALWLAAGEGRDAIVSSLVSEGADVNNQ